MIKKLEKDMGRQDLLVISASRRTDLVGCYPGVIVDRLKNYPSSDVHSVVIWTKNPQNLILEGELKKALKEYRNIVKDQVISPHPGSPEFTPPWWVEGLWI
jgi:hypothetical protein